MARLHQLKKSTYHSAKISANKHLLYEKKKIADLLNLSFNEILKYMQEHQFKSSIDKTYTEYEGFYLIETLLNDHVSKIYERIIHSAPKQNKLFLDKYYLKYQIHNLMAFIRCKLAKEEHFETYLIGDRRKKDKFIKAYHMVNIEDGIAYICSKLGFDKEEVLKKYKEDIFTVENYLYKTYYEQLSATKFSYNNKDEKRFVAFTKKYIDLINARTFLKIENEKQPELFATVFLPGGIIAQKTFSELEKESLEQKTKKISALLTKAHGLVEFEKKIELDETIVAHKQESSTFLKNIGFGSPFYALKFLFALEKEIAQLRILLKAKYLNLEKAEIQALLHI